MLNIINTKQMFDQDGKQSYTNVQMAVASTAALTAAHSDAKFVQDPLLAPSVELFRDYRNWVANGEWNAQKFREEYLPRFLSQFSVRRRGTPFEALRSLVMDVVSDRDFSLACFCEDETLCHRSILVGILQGLGLGDKISGVQGDYSEYYDMLAQAYPDVAQSLQSCVKIRTDYKNGVMKGTQSNDVVADFIAKHNVSSISFTGHRPSSLKKNGYDYTTTDKWSNMGLHIADALSQMAGSGLSRVVTGGAQGVDQTACIAANNVKSLGVQLENVIYRPNDQFMKNWTQTGKFSQEEYANLERNADEVCDVTVRFPIRKGAKYAESLMNRNHAMVDDTDAVFAVYPHEDDYTSDHSGTAEAIRYALSHHRPVLMLDPVSFQYLTIEPDGKTEEYVGEITSFRGAYQNLSNFYGGPVEHTVLGRRYVFRNAEAAFQASKCVRHEDVEQFIGMDAKEAREAGRKVELRSDWELVKTSIMANILRSKFSNPEFAQLLENTGTAKLVEGNTWGDTTWGVTPDGKGENHLGRLLMQIRAENRQRPLYDRSQQVQPAAQTEAERTEEDSALLSLMSLNVSSEAPVRTEEWTRYTMNGYLHEYYFCRCLNVVNKALYEANADHMEGSLHPVLTMEDGRALHAKVLEGIRKVVHSKARMEWMKNGGVEPVVTFNDIFMNNVPMMEDVMNEVFAEANNGHPLFVSEAEFQANNGEYPDGSAMLIRMNPGSQNPSAFYTSCSKEFMDQLGWAPGWSAMIEDGQYPEMKAQLGAQSDSYLPISPFDERYQYRESMISRGMDVYYVDASKFLVREPVLRKQYLDYRADYLANHMSAEDRAKMSDEDVEEAVYKAYEVDRSKARDISAMRYAIPIVNEEEQAGIEVFAYETSDKFLNGVWNRKRKSIGMLYGGGDEIGISRIRKYVSQQDYALLQKVVSGVPKGRRITKSGFDRSLAILRMLRENGIPFTLRENREGQVEARIGNTKMDIRITDTKENERMIGRVYNNGVAYMLTKINDSKGIRRVNRSYQPTIEETLSLVQYALGERTPRILDDHNRLHVDRFGEWTNFVGGIAEYASNNRGRNASKTAGTDVQEQYSYMSRDNKGKIVETTLLSAKSGSGRLFVTTSNNRSPGSDYFNTEEDAVGFLEHAVDSAKAHFLNELDLDYLIAQVHVWEENYTYVPDFSSDPRISAIQMDYWDVLTGVVDKLRRPSEKRGDRAYQMLIRGIGAGFDGDDYEDDDDLPLVFDDEYYEGFPEDVVRAHMMDLMEHTFGSYEYDKDRGGRFNAGLVAEFMDGNGSVQRNRENLIEAMRSIGMDADELIGDDFANNTIKDELLYFDSESAVSLSQKVKDEASAHPEQSAYLSDIYQTVRNTIEDCACKLRIPVTDADGHRHLTDEKIEIDKNGVIHYVAYQVVVTTAEDGSQKSIREVPVEGYIGQVFVPDEDHMIETKYNGSRNQVFVPGMEGRIIDQVPGENKSYMERTRVRTIKDIVKTNIKLTIRSDLTADGATLDADTYGSRVVGKVTSINNSYRSMPEVKRFPVRLSVDYDIENGEYADRITPEIREAYDGIFHIWQRDSNGDIVYDENGRPVSDIGPVKMRWLEQNMLLGNTPELAKALLDQAASVVSYPKEYAEESGMSGYREKRRRESERNMGAYLNATVSDFRDYANVINADITKHHGCCDGYTDPMQLGAAANQGLKRHLVVGTTVNSDGSISPSKIKDAKCPIMYVDPMLDEIYNPVDRTTMTGGNTEDCQSVQKDVGFAMITLGGFTCDDGFVVAKKFAEKAIVVGDEGEPRPLRVGDKLCVPGGNKGVISIIIDPDWSEEEAKQKGLFEPWKLFHDNPDLDLVGAPYSPMSRANGGTARGMHKGYENGSHPQMNEIADVYENVQTTLPDMKLPNGMEIYGTFGKISVIVTDKLEEEKSNDTNGRRVASQTAWAFLAKYSPGIFREVYGKDASSVMNLREYLLTVGADIGPDGALIVGYQPHPGEERRVFSFPTDEEIQRYSDRDLKMYFRDNIGTKGGMLELPFPLKTKMDGILSEIDPSVCSRPGHKTYGLPVMSSYLRSGQEFQDGQSMVHDYTNQYASILRSAIEWRRADLNTGLTADERAKKKAVAVASAQASYDTIANSVIERKFEGKHNIFREEICARRMRDSATSVITADPRLGLDEIALSKRTMEALHVKPGEQIMVWRDPALHTRCFTALTVTERTDDPNGMAVNINPLIASNFDGDFDGDSVALLNLHSEEAREELKYRWSPQQNLLNPTVPSSVYEGGSSLYINSEMDVCSEEYLDGEAVALKKNESNLKQIRMKYGEYLSEIIKAKADEMGEEYVSLRERREQLEIRANEIYFDDTLTDEQRYEKNTALMQELDEWSKECLEGTVATSYVRFDTWEHLIEDMDYMAASGAKGSRKKIDEFCKYAGLDIRTDNEGNRVMIVDAGHSLATLDDITGVQTAQSCKSEATPSAGTISQKIVQAYANKSYASLRKAQGYETDYNAVCRAYAKGMIDKDEAKRQLLTNPSALDVARQDRQNDTKASDLAVALDITYGATQTTLQAKHDPDKANVVFNVVRYVMPELMSGHRLEPKVDMMTQHKTWVPVRGDDGKCIQMTKNEWIKQAEEIYLAKDGMDLGAVNHKELEQIASLMTDEHGRIRDINNRKVTKEIASPIDVLCYSGGRFQTLKEFCHDGVNLFDGRGSMFLPDLVRTNQAHAAVGEMDQVRCIAKSDTQMGNNKRVKARIYEVSTAGRHVQEPFRQQEFAENAVSGETYVYEKDEYGNYVTRPVEPQEAAEYETPAVKVSVQIDTSDTEQRSVVESAIGGHHAAITPVSPLGLEDLMKMGVINGVSRSADKAFSGQLGRGDTNVNIQITIKGSKEYPRASEAMTETTEKQPAEEDVKTA